MTNVALKPEMLEKPMNRSRLSEFFSRLVKTKPLGTLCGCIILFLILMAILAPYISPYPYIEVHPPDRLQGMSSKYFLGTDQLGRDLFSRLLFGARISLGVGLAATAVDIVVSFIVGGASGFLGRKYDLIMQRFVDAWIAFPGLLLLLTVMSVSGKGIPQLIFVLGISGGISGSRIVRAAVIGIKENDYFLAAFAIGSDTYQTMKRHVIPNITPVMIVIFSITIGGMIIAESSLSFLGFGLPAQIPSWGGMLSREGRDYMEISPGLALWPGFFLTLTVYSLNMVGDAVRDLLDPRLRGSN